MPRARLALLTLAGGLLFITGAALSMDDIMQRLDISRGNACMNLRQLLEWGLVRQVHKRGDRRDYYETQHDVLEMFTTIAIQTYCPEEVANILGGNISGLQQLPGMAGIPGMAGTPGMPGMIPGI